MYLNLVEGRLWVPAVAGSSPAIQTEADLQGQSLDRAIVGCLAYSPLAGRRENTRTLRVRSYPKGDSRRDGTFIKVASATEGRP